MNPGLLRIVLVGLLIAAGGFALWAQLGLSFDDEPLLPSGAEGLVCPDGTRATTSWSTRERFCETPNGLREGPSIEWDDRGAKTLTGEYRDGHREGVWTMWESGRNGGTLRFRNGKMHGAAVTFHDNGRTKMEVPHRDGQLHGPFTQWHAGGHRKVHGQYHNGRKDGVWQQWNDRGELLGSFTMSDGTGTDVTWRENGQKLRETEYRDGIRHGGYVRWYDNGQKMMEGEYRNGHKHGTWITWRDSGAVKKTETYMDGKRVPGQRSKVATPP